MKITKVSNIVICSLLIFFLINCSKFNIYKPNIFISIVYNPMKKNIINIIKNIRSLEFLNKFLKGVKIIKINPIKLLIKNRG